jgi:hypothetical protein
MTRRSGRKIMMLSTPARYMRGHPIAGLPRDREDQLGQNVIEAFRGMLELVQ